MAHDRRVSFVYNSQGAAGRGGNEEVEDSGRTQQTSVFNRLGPKLSMGDPPYVPESVGHPPLPGMIFGCTNETYHECVNRMLFGLPVANKPQVMRIAPRATLFLFNFRSKHLYGIFEATSHGGMHIEREAFGGKFGAQVKVRVAEQCPALEEREFKEAIRFNYVDARKFKFSLNEAQVDRLKRLFREKAAARTLPVSEGRRSVQMNGKNSQVQRRVVSSGFSDGVDGSRKVHISAPSGKSSLFASPSNNRSPSSPKGLEVSISGRAFSEDVEGSRTVHISAPPTSSRVYPSPSNTRMHAPKGLEVSISVKDKKRNVLASKIIKQGRHETGKEGVHSELGRRTSLDRKRGAGSSPQGRLFMQEQDQRRDRERSRKQCSDLRELLTRPNPKRLKTSTDDLGDKLLSKLSDPPVDSRGKSTRSVENLKTDLEQGPSKKSLNSLKAGSPKDQGTPAASKSILKLRKLSPRTTGQAGEQVLNREGLSTASGSRSANAKPTAEDLKGKNIIEAGRSSANAKSTAEDLKGKSIIEAGRSENASCDVNLGSKLASSAGVAHREPLSTDIPTQSGALHNLQEKRTDSEPGDKLKDGGLDIYVSLPVEEAKIARPTDPRITSENQHGIDGVDAVAKSVLGKRSRESKLQEPAPGSSVANQLSEAERFVLQQIGGLKKVYPEGSEGTRTLVSEVSLFLADVTRTLRGREYVPSAAGGQQLTSQGHLRNSNLDNGNSSKVEKQQLAPVNNSPSNAVSVLKTVNTGDSRPWDGKKPKVGNEGAPASLVQSGSERNKAGCSHVTPKVVTPTEGSDLRKIVLQRNELDSKMLPEEPSHSLPSGKSGDLWNARRARYGRPCSADPSANGGSRFTKSGSEPTSSEPTVGCMKTGDESVYSGGENNKEQPEGSDGTETSSLRSQQPLLVCELGNPGGLSLDAKLIRVDTPGDSLRKDQLNRVTAVEQESTLSDRIKAMSTALGLSRTEFRKRVSTLKSRIEDDPLVTHSDDIPSKESVQATMVVSNGGSAHPSLLSQRADAPQGERACAADAVKHGLVATSRGFPSASTATASLSDCSEPSGEAELEINIPIEDEELEICLPIEEDEDVNVVPPEQMRRLWGSSNRDITPWKLLKKNPPQDA